jgi:hypothetical protein
VGHDVGQERLIITLNADARVLPQEAVEVIGRLYDAVLTQLVEHVDAAVTDVSGDVRSLADALGELFPGWSPCPRAPTTLTNAAESSR